MIRSGRQRRADFKGSSNETRALNVSGLAFSGQDVWFLDSQLGRILDAAAWSVTSISNGVNARRNSFASRSASVCLRTVLKTWNARGTSTLTVPPPYSRGRSCYHHTSIGRHDKLLQRMLCYTVRHVQRLSMAGRFSKSGRWPSPGFPVDLVRVGELYAASLNESRRRGRWWRPWQEIRVAHCFRPTYAQARGTRPDSLRFPPGRVIRER
jgi:hypothetical protein